MQKNITRVNIMGCWHKTCGLTQMPIFSGDAVITFYLIEKPFKTDAMTSYTSGYWSYIPLPFYDESGGFGASIIKSRIKEKINSIPENVLIDAFLAEIILSRLRKQWYPAGHEGSQDELNSNHKAFLKAYKARMHVIEHQWDDL